MRPLAGALVHGVADKYNVPELKEGMLESAWSISGGHSAQLFRLMPLVHALSFEAANDTTARLNISLTFCDVEQSSKSWSKSCEASHGGFAKSGSRSYKRTNFSTTRLQQTKRHRACRMSTMEISENNRTHGWCLCQTWQQRVFGASSNDRLVKPLGLAKSSTHVPTIDLTAVSWDIDGLNGGIFEIRVLGLTRGLKGGLKDGRRHMRPLSA